MFAFLEKLLTPRTEIAPTLTLDGDGLMTPTSDGRYERLAWKDIRRVTIVTSDQGPWLDDVFFVLEGIDGNIVVPHEQAVEIELLNHLQKLPGFDNEAVIRAMSCTDNNSFVCWSSDNAA